MTRWLLKWLDVRVDSGVDIAGATLDFRGSIGWGGWLFGVILLAAASYAAYRMSPSHLARGRRLLLTGLRAAFLGSLLFLLLRPVLAFTVEGSVRRLLIVLLDNSASLKIPDPRTTPDDQARAAIARGVIAPDGGLKQPIPARDANLVTKAPRLELVRGVLQNPRMNLLARLRKHFDLAGYQFGTTLGDLSLDSAPGGGGTGSNLFNVAQLDGHYSTTALGDAVRDAVSRKRGQPLAGVLVITDGANNSGSPPLEAADHLKSEGVPLYIYGVGLTSPRDIIVTSLLAPEVTFVDEEMDVLVRVRGQGYVGQSATVKLRLGDAVYEQPVTFTGAAEQVVSFPIIPKALGEMELEASIAPRPDEAVTDNNQRKQRIKIVDSRINVLLVDQGPRWEFRYLQAMLLRDRRVNLKCYLVEGDPGISRTEQSPYLASFPTRRDDLLRYDLVIFGDVDPRFVTPMQQENLSELVSKFGGALMVVAGKRFTPQAYRRSVLYPMLPVEFESTGVEAVNDTAPNDKPIRLELTSAGRASPMMRLGDNEARSREIWQQMPPVYWVSRVSRPKPAAEVLMVDPDPARESRFGKMPVIALHQYGLGQVLYIGTDNTWRWRRNSGDSYYSAFWGQLVQRLSLPRLLGGNKRIQLSADRQNYIAGDRVSLVGRLYSAAFEAIQDPVVKGHYSKKGQVGGAASEVLMRPVQDQPGLYRGEFIAGAPGDYQFSVDLDPTSAVEFSVIEPQFELGDTAMNEGLLRQMAKTTTGGYFREEDLYQLPDMLNTRTEKVRSPLEVDLWSSPLVFLFLMALVTTEWVIRKRSFLK